VPRIYVISVGYFLKRFKDLLMFTFCVYSIILDVFNIWFQFYVYNFIFCCLIFLCFICTVTYLCMSLSIYLFLGGFE
jgi:hypothetical protein